MGENLRTLPIGIIAAAAAAAAANVARAGVGTSNVFEYRVQNELNSNTFEHVEFNYVGPLVGTLSDTTGTVLARANVGLGVNKAVATVTGPTATNPIRTALSQGFSSWADVVTINNPGHNGEPGSFSGNLQILGAGNFSLSPSLANDPDVSVLAHWTAATDAYPSIHGGSGSMPPQTVGFGGGWSHEAGQPLAYSGDALNAQTSDFTFHIIFGAPFVLRTHLQSEIRFRNDPITPTQGTVDATIDLGNSVYWGGMSAIRDASGNLVTNAAITSQSGVRWDAAVIPASTRGDFDGNGNVNLLDFNILADHFNGSVAPWQQGDATGDGVVNLLDFNVLAANFNQTISREPTAGDWSALASAVPEPGAAFGLTIAMALSHRRLRRRGR